MSSYLINEVGACAKRNKLSKLGIKRGYHHVTEFQCVWLLVQPSHSCFSLFCCTFSGVVLSELNCTFLPKSGLYLLWEKSIIIPQKICWSVNYGVYLVLKICVYNCGSNVPFPPPPSFPTDSRSSGCIRRLWRRGQWLMLPSFDWSLWTLHSQTYPWSSNLLLQRWRNKSYILVTSISYVYAARNTKNCAYITCHNCGFVSTAV